MGVLDRFTKRSVLQTQSVVTIKEWSTGSFVGSTTDIYKSEIARSAIHTIANNASKLRARHVRRDGMDIKPGDNAINYLIQVRPNSIMSASQLWYKVVTQMLVKGDGFIHIIRDLGGKPVELNPINFNRYEVYIEEAGEFIKFDVGGGKVKVIDYQDLIHLRKFFNDGVVKSEDPISAFSNTLDAANTMVQGITNAVKNSAKLRGILISEGVLKPKDLKENADNFRREYLNTENNGGIAALDGKATYQELKPDYKTFDADQMEYIKDMVYSYFNVNDNIVQSKYSEADWDAFYESVLEPISLQFSLECTHKFFSDRERGFGNEIVFESNRLAYVSTKTKIQLVKETAPLGIFTINEVRTEIFNMSPIEGGDVRLQTLNVVNADKANQYQGVDEGTEGNDEDDQQGQGV